ncbi:TPA: PGF-pre-PGF domain-containing protein [Candidatus Woesearchaeota archaeon]|nr:PGF-pre-PGF domain-containing protein [Candidatus Woesearchaeota archaeon]
MDRTAPLISVSCLPDSPSEGVDVECTCTATDTGDSGIKIAALFGHGTATESFKASGTSEVSSSVCSSTDYAGNKGTGSGSFTPTAASGGSGGSSGGSGGGISRAAAGNFKKTTWNSINAGEIATVEPDNGVIGVSKVSFGLKEKKWGVWMKVAKKDSIPSEFKPFGNKAHKIIEITKSLSIKEGDFVSPTIDIKVEKSWVNDNNLGRNDVALHRYHDSVWNQLETEFVKDDGTYLHYSAKTPGFSYFIIGTKDQVSGKTAEEVAEAAAEAMALEEASEEAPGRDMGADGDELVGAESNLTRNIVIVLAVLIVIAVAAFLMKRRK